MRTQHGGILFIVDERARRRQREITPRSDRGDAALGFEHVAVAGDDERHFLVGDDHHRFEVAEIFVGPPVLGEFDRGAKQLAVVAFELGFEPLEQREGVGGRAGETADDAAVVETAHLAGVGLHHRLAHRYLAVADDDDLVGAASGKDGGSVPGRGTLRMGVGHGRGYGRWRARPQGGRPGSSGGPGQECAGALVDLDRLRIGKQHRLAERHIFAGDAAPG